MWASGVSGIPGDLEENTNEKRSEPGMTICCNLAQLKLEVQMEVGNMPS